MFWFELMEKRWFAWLNVVTGTVFGLFWSVLAVAAALEGMPTAAAGSVLFAAFWGVGLASASLRFLSRGVPHRVTEEQGAQGAVTVLWLHRSKSWLGVTGTGIASSGLALATIVMFIRDEQGVGWTFGVITAFFVSFLPDHVRALVRRPRLELSPSGIRYRGQSVDAELEWDDVMSVLGSDNARGGSLRLDTWSDSGRAKAGRIIWRFEDKPLGSEIAVTSNEPRDAELLGPVRVWIEEYWRQPHRRGELGTPAARERLELLRRMVEVPS